MTEFELFDIFEQTSIESMDSVLEGNIKYALVKQHKFPKDCSVIVLPCCWNSEYSKGFLVCSAPFEVFADDHNTIIARGTVIAEFAVFDEKVFEDYKLERLELMRIEGILEKVK